MKTLISFANRIHDILDSTSKLDFLAPLLLRLFLGIIFIAAGLQKATGFEDIVNWFGNPEWGLGLPFPWLMAFLATAAELVGGILLLAGFATRYVTVPLMVTMLVAIFAVHWSNGWFAIAPSNPDTNFARPLALVGIPAAQQSLEKSTATGEKIQAARSLLREHGNYEWLTSHGNFVILQNGIEFGATYFIMLLVLFFSGAGRFVSLDYWIHKKFRASS